MWLIVSWLLREVFNTVYFHLFGDSLPTQAEMKPVGTVSKLCLYPLKSGRRVEADELVCKPIGPCLNGTVDRSFVVTDEAGGFLSARRHPQLLLVAAEVQPDGVRLTAPGVPPLVVRGAQVASQDRRCQVRVWRDHVPALDCGDEAAAWLAAAVPSLPAGVRLRWFAGGKSARRPRVPPFRVRAGDGSAFADLTGYMLMNAASVEELNGRLARPVSVDAFRPNVVVAGAAAFAEDRWRYLAVGDALFENVKPCTRCVFTTIDPETGTPDEDGQPLKTLKQYRLNADPALSGVLGSAPLFGINLGLRRPGVIRVGDVVYATEA